MIVGSTGIWMRDRSIKMLNELSIGDTTALGNSITSIDRLPYNPAVHGNIVRLQGSGLASLLLTSDTLIQNQPITSCSLSTNLPFLVYAKTRTQDLSEIFNLLSKIEVSISKSAPIKIIIADVKELSKVSQKLLSAGKKSLILYERIREVFEFALGKLIGFHSVMSFRGHGSLKLAASVQMLAWQLGYNSKLEIGGGNYCLRHLEYTKDFSHSSKSNSANISLIANFNARKTYPVWSISVNDIQLLPTIGGILSMR